LLRAAMIRPSPAVICDADAVPGVGRESITSHEFIRNLASQFALDDFHAFSAPRRSNLLTTTTLGRCKRGIDEAFRFIDLAFFAQRFARSVRTLRNTSSRHHCWKRRCTVL